MGNPVHAFGTTFTWNSVVVGGLTAINGIKVKTNFIDVTTHASANNYMEFLPGLLQADNVTLEGQFEYTDTTGQHALLSDQNSKTSRTGLITFPAATGATWTFTGYVEETEIGNAPLDGKIPFSASIRITGKPAFAVATSAGLTTPFFTVNNSGVIAPTAAQATTEYVVTYLTAVTSTTITPTASAGVITITANGVTQTVSSGVASSAITLGSAGSITNATITVTETNKAPKIYTLHLTRA